MNIYRFFDENGVLLYVGKTLVPLRRIREHSSKTAWFIEVRSITIERCRSKKDASKKESIAVVVENPKYNIYTPVAFYVSPKELADAESKYRQQSAISE